MSLAEEFARPSATAPLAIMNPTHTSVPQTPGHVLVDNDQTVVAKHPVPCPVFFSPSHEELAAGTLADWILEDRLPVRLQVQLHKVLWGNVPGR